jgi:hypothetical protein
MSAPWQNQEVPENTLTVQIIDHGTEFEVRIYAAGDTSPLPLPLAEAYGMSVDEAIRLAFGRLAL